MDGMDGWNGCMHWDGWIDGMMEWMHGWDGWNGWKPGWNGWLDGFGRISEPKSIRLGGCAGWVDYASEFPPCGGNRRDQKKSQILCFQGSSAGLFSAKVIDRHFLRRLEIVALANRIEHFFSKFDFFNFFILGIIFACMCVCAVVFASVIFVSLS